MKIEPACEPSPTPQAIRQRLGPTPQKDGQILGLFDSLSATPSKTRDPLASIDGNTTATPSKGTATLVLRSPEADNTRLSRTPASSGKRFLFDSFATPMKRKRDEEQSTPSGTKGAAETPAFLRRIDMGQFNSTLDPLEETDEVGHANTREPPFKKRGLVRSLSAIIRNMKQQEEDDADEDLAIMRELEQEAEGNLSTSVTTTRPSNKPEVQIEDSQLEMPLGPDRDPESDEDEEDDDDGLDQNGQPRKVWKKRGQKRTTRRVIMRPAPRPKTAESQALTPNSQVVHETQLAELPSAHAPEHEMDANGDSDSDFEESDLSKTTKSTQQSQQTEKVGPLKKAARKISVAAHANYCKLKIKNQNSKAKGRGRFGRR